jgi:hypothetical protein
MEFEFDEQKSRANKAKHGLDFVEAQALWYDADALEIPARMDDESRNMVIGKIGDRHWSAIVTQRGEKIRLISVRRSRKKERELYES